MKKLLGTLALQLVFLSGISQSLPNNWINPGQEYFKIKVAQRGIYKISFASLNQQTATNISTVDPSHFQLFGMGKEKPISIHTGGDNRFNQGDFIEFYGEKNDGTLDTGLYTTPSAQPHKYYSLYTDSAAYFLTWNTNTAGKRFDNIGKTNYSQHSPENYFMKESVATPHGRYNDGDPLRYNTNLLGLSYYTSGESWTSQRIDPWGKIVVNVPTSNYYGAGPQPTTEMLLIGDSRYDSLNYSANQVRYHHETRIRIGNGNWFKAYYAGYSKKLITKPLQSNQIGNNTTRFIFRSESTNSSNLTGDYAVVSFVKLNYPRDFNLNGQTQFHFTLDKNKPEYFIPFTNYGLSNPILYDLSNGRKIYGKLQGQTFKTIIPGGNQSLNLFLTDSSNKTTVQPEKIEIQNYSTKITSNLEYLIITNKELSEAAQNYSNYRSSQGYNTKVVYVNNLYDQFSYGIHHPLGIRYFLEYLVKEDKEPNHLLLLGKGLQNNTVRQGDLIRLDLVPTMGQPPSDNLFVRNLGKDQSNFELEFPVGRIPASNNQEAKDYLQKVKDYENHLQMDQSTEGKPWRKNILHISGGTDKNQSQRFKSYLRDYAAIAKAPKMGADVSTISKTKSIPIDKSQEEFVIEKVNNGLNLITYFGHGAAEVLEVDIGEPEKYTQNKGNYPVFLFSGCIIGNTYTESETMAENFIMNRNNGGIVWMAESSFSFESYLDGFTTDFYRNMTGDHYGKSIGKIYIGTVKDFKNTGNNRNYFNEMQILQKTFQGDPAINLYSPSKPDYRITPQFLSFDPQNPNTELDSFALKIVIQNTGKALSDDSISIQIDQQFSDLSQKSYDPVQVEAPNNADTFYYYIKPNAQKFSGNNVFTVSITSDLQEITTANNSASIEQFFPSSGITPIFPGKYSIVAQTEVTLSAQSNNLFLQNASYIFEIDTTPKFNSPFKRNSGSIISDAFANWETSLLNKDSTVYYWRVRKQTNTPKRNWNQSSFMYIKNSPSGWAQGHFHQFLNSKTDNLSINPESRKINFDRSAAGRYDVRSTGAIKGSNSPATYHIRYEGPRLFYGGASNGIYVLAVNPDNHSRFNYASPYNSSQNRATTDGTPADTTSGVFRFNWIRSNSIDTSVVEDFVNHIDSIPKGYKVIIFTARKHKIADLPPQFYQAMEKAGSGIIREVGNGWPYILMGEKGMEPGEAKEKTADTTLPLAPSRQVIQATMTIYPLESSGTITSTLIGPSKSWEDVSLKTSSLEKKSKDTVFYDILGLDQNGNSTLIRNDLQENVAHSIDSVDAKQFPFLKIRAHLKDAENLTPPQLQNWIVHYDYVPEGSLKPDLAYSFQKDTLQQGDSLRIKMGYQNISEFPMDSVLVNYQVFNDNRQRVINQYEEFKALDPSDSILITKAISTDQISGDLQFKLTVNPNLEQPEKYLFNNIHRKNFFVKTDETNPLLDVTFNGRHIMDGAIVPPQPTVRISAKDNSEQYLMDDTSQIDVYLEKSSGIEKKLSYNGELQFYPAEKTGKNEATVIYQPKTKLENGKYKLKVQATDESGNKAGKNLYKKTFEVINESTITSFYPYPNPFTSRMRFVFTLTGSQVPDKIHIQIMTITGKVIKEITKDELGPLHIGVNKTDYVWHGRDQFGDPVGNGVYFYRVKAYLNGETIEHRETAGDKFFKKGIGKLYLMR